MNRGMKFLAGVFCVFFTPLDAFAQEIIYLDRPYVQVGDILKIDVETNPAINEMMSQRLFGLQEGRSREISSKEMRGLLVRRVPGLAKYLQVVDSSSRKFLYSRNSGELSEKCIRIKNDHETGKPILRGDVYEDMECKADPSALINYNPLQGSYAAIQQIPSGTQLPIKTHSVLPLATEGAKFLLQAKVGTVQITRPVTLTQSIFDAGPVHVRTSDGFIIRAHMDINTGVKP